MGKRNHVASEDFEFLAQKIRKLEQKLMRTRGNDKRRTSRKPSSISSSNTSTSSSRSSSESRSRSPPVRREHLIEDREALPPETLCIEGVPSTSAAADTANPSALSPLPVSSAAANIRVPSVDIAASLGMSAAAGTIIDHQLPPTAPTGVLDDEILLILGDDPSKEKSYGESVQSDLAIRLEHITRIGLQKDVRKELMDKHLVPENCILIEAPTLNPEVVAAISEPVRKRDKGIELRQKQRTSEISCVAEALTLLIKSEPKNTILIQLLMDAIKLMCDSQNNDSAIRRSLILNTLKKDLKDQLQATKTDKLLFGEGLADTLKAAKAISKSGADMKPAPITQAPLKNKSSQKHLNWRGPSQNHRPRGTRRTKEPALKNRPVSSSKQSSRPAQSRNRR